MKEPGGPLGMPKVGRDGGGGIGGGSIRSMAGITGKAGGNVSPVYKPGTSGSTKPQSGLSTKNVKEGPSNRNPSLKQNIDNFNASKMSPSQFAKSQAQAKAQAKADARGNARGIKAANKDVVRPIMRRSTEKTYGKDGAAIIVRGPIQVSKAKAAKINARNAAFRAGER